MKKLKYDEKNFMLLKNETDQELLSTLQSNYKDKELFVLLKNLKKNGVHNLKDYKKMTSYKIGDKEFFKFFNKTRFCFLPEHVVYFKSIKNVGRKRPEHSALMKIKMKGIDRGDEWRKLKGLQNKGIEHKIKFLQNKNIKIQNLSNEEIIKEYSSFISERATNRKNIEEKIRKFLVSNKYIDEPLFVEFVNKFKNIEFTAENYLLIHKQYKSLISTFAMKKDNNMGKTKFFKQGFITTKFCTNKNILKFRSAWEETTINTFIENNIEFKYEPFYIELKNGYYLPDFLFEFKGKTILLEIKGFIRGALGKEKELQKIHYAEKYCKKNNLIYIYLTKPLTNLKQIENELENRKTKI